MKTTKSHLPKEFPKDFLGLVRMHPPLAIHDEAAYDNAQEVLDRLTRIPDLTEGQLEYLDTLSVLFEAYEKALEPFDDEPLSGLEALKFLMEQHSMNASDLGRLLGDRALGGRILKGERSLSKAHIRTLCERFKVKPDLFWDFL